MNKTFELRDILTVTTGRLLTKSKSDKDNGISSLYIILDYLTGVSNFTHQLGQASTKVKPTLLSLHPELGNVNLDYLDELLQDDDKGLAILTWLDYCISDCKMKAEYILSPLNISKIR